MSYYSDKQYDFNYSGHVIHNYDMRFTDGQKRMGKPSKRRTYKDLDDYDNRGYDTYDYDDEYCR